MRALIEIKKCPVCNGTGFKSFIECEDYLVTHSKFTLQKCAACGFTLTNPQPSPADIGIYYESENYISHTGGKKSLFDRAYTFVRSKMLKTKRILIEKNSTGRTILDIGCGTGDFLNEMKKNGWASVGVEPSATARQKAQEKDLRIIENIEGLDNTQYDIVTLWHVLEHLHSPDAQLKKIHQLLKNTGKLIVALPNLESYDANYYQAYWAGYDVPRHLWHFNKSTIRKILEANGFQLLQIAPMKFDSFYVSLLSESYKNPNRNKLYQAICALLQGIKSNWKASRSMNYSSHIYIATKCE
ncbi:MAG: class I SAM-dependent methyltransferase [Bacteroidetes bacterium]|nr:class I SAM-dependent methyltransferase [Bacteroidota bacterium]MBS1540724.1 class I SAM-dependent methyltransferase [Bacteroidota bacterium]